jgi:SAM-dependent methyltransferase
MVDHYNDYAQFYDKGTTTDIDSKVNLLRSVIKRLSPNAVSFLELACGTGNILAQFKDEYNVTGLDLSPNMVMIAQAKLPNVVFHIEDMTSFTLAEKFDVIICVFDSVNHLLLFEQWESLFDRAKLHLNEDGVFIMDVNTISKLERFSGLPESKLELRNGYQVAKIVKGKEGIYHWHLDIYEPQNDDTGKVTRNIIPETAFPLERIKDSLAVRFSFVELFTPNDTEPSESVDRVYFACKI